MTFLVYIASDGNPYWHEPSGQIIRPLSLREAADEIDRLRSAPCDMTPEMIKAGAAALETWRGSCHDEMIVEKVYRAMHALETSGPDAWATFTAASDAVAKTYRALK